MSRHVFHIEHNGSLKYVLMGWDSPLQGYFMVIDDLYSEEDEPYWSNLNLEVSHPKTLDLFLQVLAQENIVLPKEMIEEIREDGRQNIGNKDVTHCYEEGIYKRYEDIAI